MSESMGHGVQPPSLTTRVAEAELELTALRARLRELEAQFAAVACLSEDLQLVPTLRRFRDRLVTFIPELSMAVGLWERDGAVRFPFADGVLAGLTVSEAVADSSPLAEAVRKGAATCLDQEGVAQLGLRFSGEPHQFLLAPLEEGDAGRLGLLLFARPTRLGFMAEERRLVIMAARLFASTLKKVMLFEQTKELAITDPLTQVYNRRHLQERLEQEVARAQRYSHPLTVLLIDIDHFKLFNDGNGHLQGDVALRQLAAVLRRHTRQADLVARFGGEEFVVVLPEIDAANGRAVAEKLRLTVEQIPFAGEETLPSGQLTISVGVATFPTEAQDAVQLLDLADRGLYLAKRRGRNRVGHFLDEA